MIDRYIQINRALRMLVKRAYDFMDEHMYDDTSTALGTISNYIKRDIRDLARLWPDDLPIETLDLLGQALAKEDRDSFQTAVEEIIPAVEDTIDDYFSKQPVGDIRSNVLDLLHPIIIQSSYQQFRSGLYRDAVLNAVVAVFDLIRQRTNIDKDGADLAAEAFSLSRPLLAVSALDSESGRSDQKGFIQLLQGTYLGIRNPKAHSLTSDLTEVATAQHLVLASLLARRVSEAKDFGSNETV